MAINTDKNSYTIFFSVIMVLVVGSLLAGFASGLKPRILANERYEKQQNILYAMGVNTNEGHNDVEFITTDVVEAEFGKYITRQIVLEGDKETEDEKAYLIDIKKEGVSSVWYSIENTKVQTKPMILSGFFKLIIYRI